MNSSVLAMALDCAINPDLQLCVDCVDDQETGAVKAVAPNGKLLVVDNAYCKDGKSVASVINALRNLAPDTQISVLFTGYDAEQDELVIDETSVLYDISSILLEPTGATTLKCRRHCDGG